jgi:hypothetical protein
VGEVLRELVGAARRLRVADHLETHPRVEVAQGAESALLQGEGCGEQSGRLLPQAGGRGRSRSSRRWRRGRSCCTPLSLASSSRRGVIVNFISIFIFIYIFISNIGGGRGADKPAEEMLVLHELLPSIAHPLGARRLFPKKCPICIDFARPLGVVLPERVEGVEETRRLILLLQPKHIPHLVHGSCRAVPFFLIFYVKIK